MVDLIHPPCKTTLCYFELAGCCSCFVGSEDFVCLVGEKRRSTSWKGGEAAIIRVLRLEVRSILKYCLSI